MPNIWTIPIEGGWTSQITLHEDAVKAIKFSPAKKEIIYQSDAGGDENMQIFLISDKGGEAKNLTSSHSGSQVYFIDFDKKGEKILYTSNKRDKRFFDTYTCDLKTNEEKCIYTSENLNSEVPSAWDKTSRFVVYSRFYDNSNQDVLLYDTETGKMINVTEHQGIMKNFNGFLTRKARLFIFYPIMKENLQPWHITKSKAVLLTG